MTDEEILYKAANILAERQSGIIASVAVFEQAEATRIEREKAEYRDTVIQIYVSCTERIMHVDSVYESPSVLRQVLLNFQRARKAYEALEDTPTQ